MLPIERIEEAEADGNDDGGCGGNDEIKLASSKYAPLKSRCKHSVRSKNRHKSNNRLRPTAAAGSQLVMSFSEYLASRNVINQCSRYERLAAKQRKRRGSARLDNDNGDDDDDESGDDESERRRQRLSGDPSPVFVVAKHNQVIESGAATPVKRGRVKQLVAGLFKRNQKNRRLLLLSLVRAPIVLAAMFSLLLVASLMVLYTMSSASHQHHLIGDGSAAGAAARRPPPHHTTSSRRQRFLAGGDAGADANPDPDDDETDNQELEAELRASARGQVNETRAFSLAKTNHKSDYYSESERENGTAAAASTDTFEAALTVRTECGSFVGQLEANAIVFRGIPYASPPVNERRWKRPKPVWLEPKLCRPNARFRSTLRPHCAQLGPIARRFSGHEDCLYLDVYAPALNQAKKLPVMVYIHGGFLAYGSSGLGQVNWMKARPSAKLASELNVVLVAFNYRLQALGFLTLVQLAQNNGPDGSEGNYGLWDQLAALNWVRRNIESFGGDPNNVVLFGPDSASALPLAMLTTAEVDARRGGEANETGRAADESAPAKVSRSAAHLELLGPSADLFRAVWLTNPTVFYELPYELASKHYQRLFLNQLPNCFNSSATAANNSDSDSQSAGNGSRMLACLMSLSAEQVARQYLNADDPTYRLDDQNSLPIHGIFADQFVTIDRELVHRSYPYQFTESESESNKTCNRATTTTTQPNETATRGNYGGCGADDNCAGPICAPNQLRPAGKDLLLGSSAQAVGYWPCPRNLNQWSWEEFERYVSTSLNSFSPTTYKRATELYGLEEANSSSSLRASPGAANVYLTMVSDIKQICPANRLANSLAAIGHRVRRYIVEPSAAGGVESSFNSRRNETTTTTPTADELGHAFHMWDLIAFFGFEFEPNFEPTRDDLKFQAEIREMVRSFVHRPDDWRHRRPGASPPPPKSITVIDKKGEKRSADEYKEKECKMWGQHLGDSYAWIS